MMIEQDTEIGAPQGVASAAIEDDTRKSQRTAVLPEATMTGTSPALHRLLLALDEPQQEATQLGRWRWAVRQRMAGLRDALVAEGDTLADGWLAARGVSILRERNALVTRLSNLGPAVLESPDVAKVRADLKRLAVDISHHCQRLHDLAYDEVELELGGSE